MKVHGMKAEDITPEMKQEIRGLRTYPKSRV
jgi:hypothetical protein